MRGFAVLAPMLLLACGDDPRDLRWTVEFAEPELAARAQVLDVSVVAGGCRFGVSRYSATVARGDEGRAPVVLPPGEYGFRVRARDASCVWFAEGCAVASLPLETDALVVELRAVAEAPACAADDCAEGICADESGDAGAPDASTPDAGPPPLDAGPPPPDAGRPPTDAGAPDAGAPDAGAPDAGAPDAGAPDAGAPDAGPPDPPDAGTPDAGSGETDITFPCAGVGSGVRRDCGWVHAGRFECAPDRSYVGACSTACGVGSCTGDPVIRVCRASVGFACTNDVALGSNDDSSCPGEGVCPGLEFTCPAEGAVRVFTGPLVTSMVSWTCAPDVALP